MQGESHVVPFLSGKVMWFFFFHENRRNTAKILRTMSFNGIYFLHFEKSFSPSAPTFDECESCSVHST
jgi:hypothetical protein